MAVPLFGFALWRFAIDTAANSLIGLLGWRLAVTVVGASALAVVMPLAWQIGDRPEDHGLYPDGASPDPDTVLPDYTWREAVRSRSFWFLVAGDGCLFSVGLASWLVARPFPFFHYDEVYPFDGYYPWGALFDVNTSRMVASTAAILACAVIGDRVPVRYVLAGLVLLLAGALILLATETFGQQVHIRCPFGHRHGGRPSRSHLGPGHLFRTQELRYHNCHRFAVRPAVLRRDDCHPVQAVRPGPEPGRFDDARRSGAGGMPVRCAGISAGGHPAAGALTAIASGGLMFGRRHHSRSGAGHDPAPRS